MITGRCECSKVRFQVNGSINDFSHCHCSQCRRLHGAAFATFAGVNRNDFSYLCGESELRSYASSESHSRIFCRHCGSNILVALIDEPNALYLSMSAIDGNPSRPPAYHIFVGSKAPWHVILDDAEQFDTFPENED
ncbi:GFA family protein [Thalassotalea nanhaiensis]|uniref:GFA family protein n=1 Tax=Thalassotalea nanhaiensis TaxID=3065648 RepID=A0ABY9TJ46_9GAMM|nr:GFA family protein [Colwelliaceae bacterium SQ345]